MEEHSREATEKLNHPRSSDLPESDERFRILSLDVGGVKGTFSAGFLAEIEQQTGRRIVDHFDLIAGTSTGGIIALALGRKKDAERDFSECLRINPELKSSLKAQLGEGDQSGLALP